MPATRLAGRERQSVAPSRLPDVPTFRSPLSCSNLPASASCTFAQDSLNLPTNGTVSTKVIIDTDAFKSHSHGIAVETVPLLKTSLNF